MQYVRHTEAQAFLAVAEPALLAAESVNGLMLGVCLKLAAGGRYGETPPFLATISAAQLELAAVMTPPFKLQLYAPASPSDEALALLADGLSAAQYAVPAVLAPEHLANRFAAVWCARTGLASRVGMRQRIYELREVREAGHPAGEFRAATEADLDTIRQWSVGFHTSCFGNTDHAPSIRAGEEMVAAGSLFVWVDREPVSMAGRTRPTPHGQTVSYVYTPPQFRRRGYATAVVAELSRLILAEGREFCMLYTDLSNPTSNSIYQQIGYRPVADVIDVHFDASNV